MSSNRFTAREPDAMTFQRANKTGRSSRLLFQRLLHVSAVVIGVVTESYMIHGPKGNVLIAFPLAFMLLFNFAIIIPKEVRTVLNFFIGVYFLAFFVLFENIAFSERPLSDVYFQMMAATVYCSVVFCAVPCTRVYPWMNLGKSYSVSTAVFRRILKFLRRFSNAGTMRYVAGGLAVVLITLGYFYFYAAPILLFRPGIEGIGWIVVVGLIMAGISVASIARFEAPTVYRSGRFSHSLLVVELIVGMVASIYWVCRFGRYFL